MVAARLTRLVGYFGFVGCTEMVDESPLERTRLLKIEGALGLLSRLPAVLAWRPLRRLIASFSTKRKK